VLRNRPAFRCIACALLAVIASVAVSAAVRSGTDWQSASQAPVGLAPAARLTPGAVVQVYAARAWGWRGVFGLTASGVEGVEINLLGLERRTGSLSPALRLPLLGRIGAARAGAGE